MTAARSADSHSAATPDPRRWAALGVALLAVFMDLVDTTIVLIAAPAMQLDLKAGYSSTQWVIAAYSLALGLGLITGGRLGDIVGRKRMFLAGVAVFTAASALCAVAPDIGALIAARVVQGAGAAMMVPQVLATIQVGFSPAERPKAFGLYGAVTGLAAAAAPVVGGMLVGSNVLGLEWRSVFWINLPVGLFSLVAGAVLMRESRSADRPRLDLPGVAVVTAGLLLLLHPLIQGPESGWPAWAWLMMAASAPVLVYFVRYQASRERVGDPLVPLSLFGSRSFVAGLIAALVMFSAVASFFMVLTLQLQIGHGFSALDVGLIFTAWPIGLATTSGVAVRFVARKGRALISIGALLLTAAMVALNATIGVAGGDIGGWDLVPALFTGGVGFGLVAPILVDMVLSSVPPNAAGAASGVTNTVIQVAGSAGVAIVGALFTTFLGHTGDFDTATQWALWYPVAAFALGFVLSRGLPASAHPTGR
ncbi:MFS transporter [Saccharopolyspora elongata]|uniref:MFS transporter n=1 Tax=Saccharopolyspora elongata TaxID=2530387 RepID=A0A4R4YCG2_9PSEU|nr:MFS transporter [Saccharopolyspora elongata]TDD41554.1 MFS transporter [Saccharopolyspora elongata]